MSNTIRTAVMTASFALSMSLGAQSAAAETEIQWWHAMGGSLGEDVLGGIAQRFNESQSEYKVVPVYKGNYSETMTGAIAAFRAKKQPHIVQVFDAGTATMMSAEGAIYPVHQLMADAGEPFDQSIFLDAVMAYYTSQEGDLLSMPFNSSTAVLYYNKDIFEKAGLDPNAPPATYEQIYDVSKKILDSGAASCGLTIGWQSWSQMENFSAWHNVPFATKDNGYAGTDTELAFNSADHVRHLETLGNWAKEGVVKYGGRRGDPNPLFINSECAMLITSSAYYAGIKKSTEFPFSTSFLPYWEWKMDKPQNSIIGGATLWVLQGHDSEEYKGVAQFLTHLASAEEQAAWHIGTGYVPITKDAYELAASQGHYEENPGTDTAIKQLTLNTPTPNSKGLRLGNFVQIRDLVNEAMEAVWLDQATAQEALDEAVAKGNELLRQFESAN